LIKINRPPYLRRGGQHGIDERVSNARRVFAKWLRRIPIRRSAAGVRRASSGASLRRRSLRSSKVMGTASHASPEHRKCLGPIDGRDASGMTGLCQSIGIGSHNAQHPSADGARALRWIGGFCCHIASVWRKPGDPCGPALRWPGIGQATVPNQAVARTANRGVQLPLLPAPTCARSQPALKAKPLIPWPDPACPWPDLGLPLARPCSDPGALARNTLWISRSDCPISSGAATVRPAITSGRFRSPKSQRRAYCNSSCIPQPLVFSMPCCIPKGAAVTNPAPGAQPGKPLDPYRQGG
jgi:hypothetical protein